MQQFMGQHPMCLKYAISRRPIDTFGNCVGSVEREARLYGAGGKSNSWPTVHNDSDLTLVTYEKDLPLGSGSNKVARYVT